LKVSVVIGVLNNVPGLTRTLKSIADQDLQKELEVIVIDDGSTLENSKAIAIECGKYPNVRCVSNRENVGLTKSLIHGCALAKGEFIARIDAGDIYLDRSHLLKSVNFLEKNCKVSVVGANIIVENKYLNKKYLMKNPSVITKVNVNGPRETLFVHVTTVFRRDVYNRVGGYSPDYYRGQDTELWKRMLFEYEGFYLPHVATLVEMQRESISIKHNNEQYLGLLRIKLKKLIQGDIQVLLPSLILLLKLLLPRRIRIAMMYRKSYSVLSEKEYARLLTTD